MHVLTVDAPYDAESARARAGVTELRTALVPSALSGIAGAHWAVGGETARNIDTDRHASGRLPWVIAFVVLLTMMIMGWVFRSAAIAIGTALMNLLSAGAAFGVLVLVFQDHWAEGLLGFHSTGAVINWIPLFTFAVLFGLSMDYHVFVLGHIREAQRDGLPIARRRPHRHRPLGRDGDERGPGHGVGVRDLRLVAHDRDEGTRAQPRRGGTRRRARGAGRDPAGVLDAHRPPGRPHRTGAPPVAQRQRERLLLGQ